MLKSILLATATLLIAGQAYAAAPNYDDIQTLVVIYAENRSFDNLYGSFPAPMAWPMRQPRSHPARPRRQADARAAGDLGRHRGEGVGTAHHAPGRADAGPDRQRS